MCKYIQDWKITESDLTNLYSGLIVKDLQITHDCKLYKTLIYPQQDNKMIEY